MERSEQLKPLELEEAILRTVAYGDVFDSPLTESEIHRYLERVAASREQVERALATMAPGRLARVDGYLCLPGREGLAAIRSARNRVAAKLWPTAVRSGHTVAGLPFVRMVALTGALAMDNVDGDADIDLLIVTETGRVWLCRSLVIQLVRLLRTRGVMVCPNWLLSEEAFPLRQRDLHAARELTQMVPLAGHDTYLRMRQANRWTEALLPNAAGPPREVACADARASRLAGFGEAVLGTSIGAFLERWESRRKIREIRRHNPANPEVVLDRSQCKGHVDGHGRRIAEAYAARLRSLSLSG